MNELTTLCREYRELQRMGEEIAAEMDALKDRIRAAASHFLELAHLSEHAAEFAPPEYSESERRAQFDRLTEENPVSIFEGVSL